MNALTENIKPWYREPWPWILMALPAAAVIFGLFYAWLAITTQDGLVDDDYYKDGLAINRTLDRDKAAKTLNIKAQLMVGDDPTHLRLMLQGGQSGTLPQHLRLKLLHPTRAGMDQVVDLTQRGEGYYEGALKSLGPARWHLVLEDTEKKWRLTGTWHVPKDHSVALDSKG
ncbi:membrane protein [Sulfurimicrobium lacus]|uniref:Membrane protein n=1 Tax=Sulfurimicrobium lacus TaxID=2715678 RepID=A0A6F8V974_9PROT|nr:FixH family protein [Sulfurimicrobium lacus]BCB25870.1 membrane protein [Sulfurimicrobium lacus]